MSPDVFIAKRQGVTLTDRASAQKHFIDLFRMLEKQTPTEADPTGTQSAVEKGAKTSGGGGADRSAETALGECPSAAHSNHPPSEAVLLHLRRLAHAGCAPLTTCNAFDFALPLAVGSI
jgi:hypothetical protein